jgi:hypothetical protein
VYTEDNTQTHFVDDRRYRLSHLDELKFPSLHFGDGLPGIDPSNHETLQQSIVDSVLRIFGSFDSIHIIAREFFVGTHQRISSISKFRFFRSLEIFDTTPRADLATLCLCILLIQQTPAGKETNMQSSLYYKVKSLINLLETANNISLDLVHCRILVTFYEMGHGLHTAAYLSVAACARVSRALGLHRKRWRNLGAEQDKLILEEEKRAWWAVIIMDRFINLCNGDALVVTDDPETTDPLPIEDLIWSEGSVPIDLEEQIFSPPFLDTPFNITVGQMARECQISHLVGRIVRHVFDPISDSAFNEEGAVQLERTLKSYLPLLANEELKIGKYCGAFGMCNRYICDFLFYQSINNTVIETLTDTALFSYYTNSF